MPKTRRWTAPDFEEAKWFKLTPLSKCQLSGNMGATYVPLASSGVNRDGTASAHWSEAVFNTELMTGFADAAPTTLPLSGLTIAALADLGYTVSSTTAESHSLPV